MDEREIHSLALLAAMSGSCIYTSDPLHLIKKDRQKLFPFPEAGYQKKSNVPFLDEGTKRNEYLFNMEKTIIAWRKAMLKRQWHVA
ncbi:MAG: hypothetical protein ACLTSZ_14210, partial [Lachnospiraceae bacterium]